MGNTSQKVVLVTGAAQGMGLAAARQFAANGSMVILADIQGEKLDEVIASLRHESGNEQISGVKADLSTRQGVDRLAESVMAQHSSLDILLNNVGGTFLSYQVTADGLELTWALNFLGHFQLTHCLLPLLRAAARLTGEARIVEVTSSIYRLSSRDFSRRQGAKGYNGVLAYAQSKRAMLVFTCEMARRLAPDAVSINAVTPGAVRTHIATGNGWLASLAMRAINRFSLPVEEGAQPIVHLASSPQLRGTSGRYFKRYQLQPDDPSCSDPQATAQLWKVCLAMLAGDICG